MDIVADLGPFPPGVNLMVTKALSPGSMLNGGKTVTEKSPIFGPEKVGIPKKVSAESPELYNPKIVSLLVPTVLEP